MLKVLIFWDITLYDPFKVADILEEYISSNFRIEHAKEKKKKKKDKPGYVLHAGFFAGFIFRL
jgi:hypothetical protein